MSEATDEKNWLHSRIVAIEAEGKITTQRLSELSTLLQVDLAKTKGELQGVSAHLAQVASSMAEMSHRTDRLIDRMSSVEADVKTARQRADDAEAKATKTSDRLIGLAIACLVGLITALAKTFIIK